MSRTYKALVTGHRCKMILSNMAVREPDEWSLNHQPDSWPSKHRILAKFEMSDDEQPQDYQ